jgi:hypothetical protein
MSRQPSLIVVSCIAYWVFPLTSVLNLIVSIFAKGYRQIDLADLFRYQESSLFFPNPPPPFSLLSLLILVAFPFRSLFSSHLGVRNIRNRTHLS